MRIATVTIDNDSAGFAAALSWIAEHAGRVVVALEGIRSYGIGLARVCSGAGYEVLEVDRPRRAERRRGKSDPGDAHLAALTALRLPVNRLPVPRCDGPREALRILLTARAELVLARTGQINRLRALLLTGNDGDRCLAHGRLPRAVLAAIAGRLGHPSDGLASTVRRSELGRTATAIVDATDQLTVNSKQLAEIAQAHAPQLVARRGVGPVRAAQTLVSWSHGRRCRNEAAFAALAGVSSVPASSGRIVRHRLNRGGDRALNRAARHHTDPLAMLPPHPRLRRPPTRRRQDRHRDPALPEALHRPRALPRP